MRAPTRLLERDPGRSARQRKARHAVERSLYVGSVHIQMRDPAQTRLAAVQTAGHPDLVLRQPGGECRCHIGLHIGEQDVGLPGCTVMRPRRTGWFSPTARRPDASVCRLAWSSARRLTWCCSAWWPAAASTPAWRMPPPKILRVRRAWRIKAALPSTSEPTGRPGPCSGTPRPNQSGCTARALPGTHRCRGVLRWPWLR